MPISVRDFHSIAESANKVGGTIRFDGNAKLAIKGTSWISRTVIWLKDHLFPNKVHAQNLSILQALENSIRDKYSRTGIKDADIKLNIERASVRKFGARGLPDAVLRILNSLPDKGGQVKVGGSVTPESDAIFTALQAKQEADLQERAALTYKKNLTAERPVTKILSQDEFAALFAAFFTHAAQSHSAESQELRATVGGRSALTPEAQGALEKIQGAGLVSSTTSGDVMNDRAFLREVQSALWMRTREGQTPTA